MSGYTADHLSEEKAYDEGDGFIAKPFSARSLLDRIRSTLAGDR